MRNWFQKCHLSIVMIIVLILVVSLIVGCRTAATSPPTPSSFFYLVQVQVKDTGEAIDTAEVIIRVGGKAPLDGITDSKGIARVRIPSNYVNEPGFLVIGEDGYETYTQNINLVEDALPDVILLEQLEIAIDIATNTPTLIPTNTPTLIPTATSTPATNTPTATPTHTPTATPTNTSTPVPEVSTPVVSAPTGRLAIPLVIGGEYRVYIASLDGKQLEVLGTACQPDYTQNGDKLVVNGEGGGLDKLRVLDPTQGPPFEIGDPSLGGHSHPAWSPDGTQVVYDDDTLGCVGWCLYVRGLNDNEGGGNILTAADSRPIVDPNPLYPLWTTDNRFIFRACNTWANRPGECGLWVMPGNAGVPERLTADPNHIPTDVHGDIVVYTFQRDVYKVNIRTRTTEQLTFDAANDGLATISSDGNWVAFLSDRDGLAVWYVSINGGSPTRLFDVPTTNWGVLDGDAWFDEKLAWGQ